MCRDHKGKNAKVMEGSSVAKWLERWLCDPGVPRSSLGRAY